MVIRSEKQSVDGEQAGRYSFGEPTSPLYRKAKRALCQLAILCLLFVASGWENATPAHAQRELIRQYQEARLRMQADRLLQQASFLLPARPYRPLEVGLESLPWLQDHEVPVEVPPASPSLVVRNWRSIRKLQRSWFRENFSDVTWAYRGTSALTTLDTTLTRVLRARLQRRFGDPMHTLGDFSSKQLDGQHRYIQFEYGLVLNDTIPLRITDVNGPLERGLVLATDRRARHHMEAIRAALWQELKGVAPAPYVDYYYEPAGKHWYRAGYDGNEYFLRAIPRPNIQFGRPWLRSGKE